MKNRIKITHPLFPGSANDPFTKSSEPNIDYNCIAWSVADNSRWWWPHQDGYWPAGISKEVTLKAFIEMFESLDYKKCETYDLESGYEKVVLYVNHHNIPTHAARQLPNGNWTSKLGEDIDVEHTLNSMNEGFYGNPVMYFKRKIK